MRFIVESEIFDLLPDVCFGVVSARGIDNTARYPQIDALLQTALGKVETGFREVNIKEHPALLPYRQAFTALGINPNKFQSSIEAMVTRVAKGKGLPAINPIVDLGNAFSLQYLLPMGAHDMGQMTEDIRVRLSRPTDRFLPFGETDAEEMPEGEAVYAVGDRIRTRRWIWRQSELGKITPQSRDIFFPIDGFTAVNGQAVLEARDALAALCRDVFGLTQVKTGLIDSSSREMAL